MSLDTVLHIGHTLRKSNDNKKYFDKIVKCPYDSKKNKYPICLSINVDSDYNIDWNSLAFTRENEKDQLYYLKYKTSDGDSSVKYVFGDIYYQLSASVDKKSKNIKVKEGGYYRARTSRTSFERGEEDVLSIIEKGCREIINFRNNLKKNQCLLQNILLYFPAVIQLLEDEESLSKPIVDYLSDENALYEMVVSINRNKLSKKEKEDVYEDEYLYLKTAGEIFIHFVFPENKHWYNIDNILSFIIDKILEEYVDVNNGFNVLNKSLYKTLCSGNEKNDIQFPDFDINSRYKSRGFSQEEVCDLFYALSFTNKGKLIPNTEIKLIVLPKGNNLSSEDYELFEDNSNEISIVSSNNDNDSFWEEETNITSFDLVFCKNGGTSPDTDLIEISNIDKSHLYNVKERINRIARTILLEEKEEIQTEKDLFLPSIGWAFKEILGVPLYNQEKDIIEFNPDKKYQMHLLNVLPKIYMGNYYNDDYLLSSFIRNVEYSIRAGKNKYVFLKYELKFLYSIQNNNNNYYMEITSSDSYQLGQALGSLAQPLGWKINSFQKTYVGMVSRRTATKEDCMQYTKDIVEKLVMHDCRFQLASCSDVCNKIASITNYDKEHFAFGFLEGYFRNSSNMTAEKFVSSIERLFDNYKDLEELSDVINDCSNIIANFKTK